MLDFVAAIEGCTVRQAALRLKHDLTLTLPAAPPVAIARERVAKKNELCRTARLYVARHRQRPSLSGRAGYRAAHGTRIRRGLLRRPWLVARSVVIPIHSARGELVAYAGRALERTEPRYRFPPGFPKSAILFNLHRARAAAQPAVVVVEGFFDC